MGFSGLLQIKSHVAIHLCLALVYSRHYLKYQMRNATPCLEVGNVQNKKQVMPHTTGQFQFHSKASNKFSGILHKLRPQTTGSA